MPHKDDCGDAQRSPGDERSLRVSPAVARSPLGRRSQGRGHTPLTFGLLSRLRSINARVRHAKSESGATRAPRTSASLRVSGPFFLYWSETGFSQSRFSLGSSSYGARRNDVSVLSCWNTAASKPGRGKAKCDPHPDSSCFNRYRGCGCGAESPDILVSWFLVHFVFALYYAHEFHSETKRSGGTGAGFDFHDQKSPDDPDFLYLSLVIGTTAQTSDIDITSRETRRTVMLHGLLSFFFNTTLIAFVVKGKPALLEVSSLDPVLMQPSEASAVVAGRRDDTDPEKVKAAQNRVAICMSQDTAIRSIALTTPSSASRSPHQSPFRDNACEEDNVGVGVFASSACLA